MQQSNLFLTVSTIQLPRSMSLLDAFAHIESRPWTLLFDTSESTHSGGRYNMVLLDPVEVVIAENGLTQTLCTDTGDIQHTDEKPLAVVERRLAEFVKRVNIVNTTAIDEATMPFLAGAAGLCGYDLGRYYESLPNSAKGDYRCPDMAMGLYCHTVIEDVETGHIIEIKPQDATSLVDIVSTDTLPDLSFSLTSEWCSNLDAQEYASKLKQVHDYIVAGDCYQINFAQRFSARYQGSEWQAYLKLRDANNAPFSAFMRLPNSCILSISPERFISAKAGIVETKPIKGTRPRSADPTIDKHHATSLLNAEKDRAENLMIVDLLRNDISKHCEPMSVNVPHLFALESYNAVHHLVSTVTGKLKPSSTNLDLLAGAFPGGSITGAPKIRAMEIIDELEPHKRNIYCGSMVYLGIRGDMDSSICIRTLLAEDDTLYCWAGGGIVLDSDTDDEYQETLHKVSKILPTLAGDA